MIIARSAIAVAIAMLAACSSPRIVGSQASGVSVVSRLEAPLPAEHLTAMAEYKYVIGPLDLLTVFVIGEPQLSVEAQVDSGGMIQLPLVGAVPAAGRSPSELTDELTAAFGKTYLRNPRVAVTVKEIRSQLVTVDGAVQQPGVYPLPGRVTLTGALALARGANDFAAVNNVAVFRNRAGQRFAAVFDLRAIRTAQMEDPPIYPGDTIVVGDDPVRRLFRDVVSGIPVLGVFRAF
jgi:polysaccharide export outer membrane protein